MVFSKPRIVTLKYMQIFLVYKNNVPIISPKHALLV